MLIEKYNRGIFERNEKENNGNFLGEWNVYQNVTG